MRCNISRSTNTLSIMEAPFLYNNRLDIIFIAYTCCVHLFRTCRTFPKAPMPMTLHNSKSLGETNRGDETVLGAVTDVIVVVVAVVIESGTTGRTVDSVSSFVEASWLLLLLSMGDDCTSNDETMLLS